MAHRVLRCDTHGRKPWRGDIICASDAGGCDRIYQTSDDAGDFFAPPICPCGAQLMPVSKGSTEPFTARSICHECFNDRVKRQKREAS